MQGLSVHLWTEPIIRVIGEDIGLYEKADITPLTARMRVHIDGLLPLIKTSVVDFPNGDSVTTTLLYERLDKHCSKCLRLDHELKECLVARAEKKALQSAQGEGSGKDLTHANQSAIPTRGISASSAHNDPNAKGKSHQSAPPLTTSLLLTMVMKTLDLPRKVDVINQSTEFTNPTQKIGT